jgi:phage terminase small subunit
MSTAAPQPPVPLAPEARRFWDRHYRRLEAAQVLTPADVDSFAVLAMTWGMVQDLAGTEPGADQYREMIQLTNLLKQYQSLAKQFGLLPRERKAAKMGHDAPAATDEFDL